MPFLIRLLVNAAALWVATKLVPGVAFTGDWVPFLGVALVFGFVNAFIRPIAKVLTFPIIIVTLGIFSLVINGLMLWLTSAVSSSLDLGFHVRGFWAAFWGALVVSIVSTLLSVMVASEYPKRSRTF
jgi:putative membrane protein